MENCWEFKNCGREPGGAMVDKKGLCPSAIHKAADGFLGGVNGGRACAFISGSFCCNTKHITGPDKGKKCASCDFFDHLRYIYGRDFSVSAFLAYIGLKKSSQTVQIESEHSLSSIKRQAAIF